LESILVSDIPNSVENIVQARDDGNLTLGGPLSITQLPNVRNIVQVKRNAENGGQPRPDINCKSTLREKMQSRFSVILTVVTDGNYVAAFFH